MSKANWALLAIPAGLAAYWYSRNRGAEPSPDPDPDPIDDCPPGYDLIDGECVDQPGPVIDPVPVPDPVPDPVPVPGGQTDAPWDGQLLIKGATGPLVTALQRVLCFLGHGSPFGNKDDVDVFGPKTRSAVKSFQTAAGIMSDGKVGSGTTLALDDACRAQGVTVGQAAQIPCGEAAPADQGGGGGGGGASPEPVVSWGVGGSGISFSPDCLDIQVSNSWIDGTLTQYLDYIIPNHPGAGSHQLASALIWGGKHGTEFEDIEGIVEAEHPQQNMYQCPQSAIDQLHYYLSNTIAGMM